MTEVLVMATLLAAGAGPDDAEAEPVVVNVDVDLVALKLESGDELVFKREELRLAIDDPAAARRSDGQRGRT